MITPQWHREERSRADRPRPVEPARSRSVALTRERWRMLTTAGIAAVLSFLISRLPQG
jgi:hypothetical protein